MWSTSCFSHSDTTGTRNSHSRLFLSRVQSTRTEFNCSQSTSCRWCAWPITHRVTGSTWCRSVQFNPLRLLWTLPLESMCSELQFANSSSVQFSSSAVNTALGLFPFSSQSKCLHYFHSFSFQSQYNISLKTPRNRCSFAVTSGCFLALCRHVRLNVDQTPGGLSAKTYICIWTFGVGLMIYIYLH